jgi:hypothetical protein
MRYRLTDRLDFAKSARPLAADSNAEQDAGQLFSGPTPAGHEMLK